MKYVYRTTKLCALLSHGTANLTQAGGFGRWLLVAPGLILILFGVAILLWPELLAYMVAGLFIAIGVSITGWGWRFSRRRRNTVAGWETIDEN